MKFTQTPTPSITATPSMTPSVSPSFTPTETVCPGLTPTMTGTPNATPTPSVTPVYTAYCACYEVVITSPAPPEGYAGSIEYYTCGTKILTGRIFASAGTYYQCASNDIGFEPVITFGTGTITDLGYNCVDGCPRIEPTPSPTNQTPTPTSPTPTPTPIYYMYAGGASTWGDSTTACNNKTCARPYYRDIPIFANGQIVYDNSALTIPFNGGGNWVAIDTATGSFCSGTGWRAIQIDSSGVILNSIACP